MSPLFFTPTKVLVWMHSGSPAIGLWEVSNAFVQGIIGHLHHIEEYERRHVFPLVIKYVTLDYRPLKKF